MSVLPTNVWINKYKKAAAIVAKLGGGIILEEQLRHRYSSSAPTNNHPSLQWHTPHHSISPPAATGPSITMTTLKVPIIFQVIHHNFSRSRSPNRMERAEMDTPSSADPKLGPSPSTPPLHRFRDFFFLCRRLFARRLDKEATAPGRWASVEPSPFALATPPTPLSFATAPFTLPRRV